MGLAHCRSLQTNLRLAYLGAFVLVFVYSETPFIHAVLAAMGALTGAYATQAGSAWCSVDPIQAMVIWSSTFVEAQADCQPDMRVRLEERSRASLRSCSPQPRPMTRLM